MTGVLKVYADGAVRKIGCGDGVDPGRLKLWDGSQWWREACDDEPGTLNTVTDTFTRADSSTAPGGTWIVHSGTWGITSNQAELVSTTPSDSTTTFNGQCFMRQEVGAGDCTIEAKATHITGGSGHLIAVGYDPSTGVGYCWFFTVDGGFSDIRRMTGPSAYTVLGSPTLTSFASGSSVLRIEHSEGVVTAFQGGVQVGQYTDTSPLTVGMWACLADAAAGQVRWDDFVADGYIPPERRPLKVNVGTPGTPDWQVAACLTPV